MKIFIKTLKGEKTEYEVQPEDTVSALKQKVKDAQGHDPELQKLIAFGKIMEDAKPLADYNIKESDQIVLMVSKPKPPPRQPEPSPQPAAQPSSAAQRPSPAQAAPQLTGPEFEQTVQRIMELGMPRDQVEAALRAARGNPDLAIEVLMGGVPASMLSGARRALHAGAPGGENPPNPAAPGDSPFAFLRTNPAMLQIRTEIQRNPALLQSFIQQLMATNPGLAQLITQNPDEFRAFLTEPIPQINPNLIAALPRPGQPSDPRPPQPSQPRIQLSPEDNAAIQNLMDLGFSRNDSLETYLSCDKNEAMAANLLFENYVPLAEQEEQRRARQAPAQPSGRGEQAPGDQPPSGDPSNPPSGDPSNPPS